MILTGAVVLGVIIYLIVAGILDAADGQILGKLSEDYVALELTYHRFDDSVKDQDKIPSGSVDARLEAFRSEAADWYLDSDCLRTTEEQIREKLTKQADGRLPIVTAISGDTLSRSVSIDGDSATVAMILRMTFETKNESAAMIVYTTLEYEKTSDGWKLTFAQIDDGVANYFMPTMDYGFGEVYE